MDPQAVRRAGLPGQDRRSGQVRADSARGQGRVAAGGGQLQVPVLGAGQGFPDGKTDVVGRGGASGRLGRFVRGGHQERRYGGRSEQRIQAAAAAALRLQEGGCGRRVLRHNIQGALQRWRCFGTTLGTEAYTPDGEYLFDIPL